MKFLVIGIFLHVLASCHSATDCKLVENFLYSTACMIKIYPGSRTMEKTLSEKMPYLNVGIDPI